MKKTYTVNVQIFLDTIFRGLNFRGEEQPTVIAAHEN